MPHPLVKAFPEIHRIACIRCSKWHFEKENLCFRCWRIKKPIDYKLEYNHGFLDGHAIFSNCFRCDRSLVEIRPISTCGTCIINYMRCINELRAQDIFPNRIKFLLHDNVSRQIVLLQASRVDDDEDLIATAIERLSLNA